MKKFIVFAIIIFFIPFHAIHHDSISIDIDCNSINGRIKFFGDINDGPLPVKNGVNLTKQYKEIGIKFIRTHDFYGPTDISSIFPDWNASVNDEKSYNFSSSDVVIKSIVENGFNVFYRLGESASDNKSKALPPKNFTKWAEICKHIVMHYNDGWCHGYHFNIKYWEIWNEPDLKGFWSGTAEDYYGLYEITAKTLKEYDASLKIGGPCVASIKNENFTSEFLNYVVSHNIPIDFFSWHMYDSNPYNLYKASLYVRKLLDSYSLHDCENINTEWNIGILSPQRDKDSEKNAAFTASCLIAFQNCNLEYAFRYRGTQDNSWLARLLGLDLSLFTYDGKYKMPALAYLAFHYMENTPYMIEANIGNGTSYIAGVSKDKRNVSILISNYGNDMPYELKIENLLDARYKIAYYLIDSSHHLQIIKRDNASSTYESHATIKKNSVIFIYATTSRLPPEGPPTAKIPLLLRLRILDPFLALFRFMLLYFVFG